MFVRRVAAAWTALACLLPLLVVARPADAAPTPTGAPAVIGSMLIGRSVDGRPIRAWHLGERTGSGHECVLLIALMHGDEPDPRLILTTLRDGPPIRGIDLWVVPVYNPDGFAAGTRQNAHGVDLNRNYPYNWKRQTGRYDSGPRPASEPETRAMMRFLLKIHPARILSFHQPLDAVEVGGDEPHFAKRVARALRLPMVRAYGSGTGTVYHGTMTQWYNHVTQGFALTVEYPADPGRRRMTVQAPREVLSIFGAHRVS